MLIGVVGWIVLGIIAGFIASKVVSLRGDDPKMGICAAAIGALIGGGFTACSAEPPSHHSTRKAFSSLPSRPSSSWWPSTAGVGKRPPEHDRNRVPHSFDGLY